MALTDCETIHALLPAYLEGELGILDRRRVAAHLNRCAEARRELAQFRALSRRLARLPDPEFPKGLHERILERVRDPSARPRELPRAARPGFPFLRPLLAAAALVVVGVFALSPDWRQLVRTGAPPTFGEKEAPKAPPPGTAPPPLKSRAEETRPAAGRVSVDRDAGADSFALEKREDSARGIQAGETAGLEGGMEREAPLSASDSRKAAAPQALRAEAPVGAENTAVPEIPRQWSGAAAPVEQAETRLILREAEFRGIWQLLHPGVTAPAVDFESRAVAAVFLGSRPTAGYGVVVEGVEASGDEWVVRWREVTPPEGAVTAQVITHPYALAVIPRPTGPVRFEKID